MHLGQFGVWYRIKVCLINGLEESDLTSQDPLYIKIQQKLCRILPKRRKAGVSTLKIQVLGRGHLYWCYA